MKLKLFILTVCVLLMPVVAIGGIEGTPTVVLTDDDFIPIWDYSANGTLKKVDADEVRNVPASTTLAGEIELATNSEMNTGNATDRANTPDALAGSVFGQKEVGWVIYDSDDNTTIANGTKGYVYPWSVDMELIDVVCSIYNLNGATSGTTTVMVRRSRAGADADMLSVGVTIGHDAYSAHDETVDTNNDDLTLGDMVFLDTDAITAGHPHVGLSCTMILSRP